MKQSLLLLSLAALPLLGVTGAPQNNTLPVPNGDFENGATGWTLGAGGPKAELSQERAASGKTSLKIIDDDEKASADATATRVPIGGAGIFLLNAKVFPVSGSGLGIYVRLLDADGKLIGKGDDFQRGAPTAPVGQWTPFSLKIYTPSEARFLELWVHSYAAAKVAAYLDDFFFTTLGADALKPPWPGTYKIKANETAKLTAADVVGPDGLVYPDWRLAGLPGGIPQVAVVAKAEEFGAVADDDRDDSAAIEKGANAVGQRGDGALLLGPGTYHLDRPVLITRDGVVLRGAGAGKTHLIFRYGVPAGTVRFLEPAPDSTVTPSTWIEAHAAPKGLQALTIEADGALVGQTKMHQHWGATFSLRTNGAAAIGKLGDKAGGAHTLTAIAEYADGKKVETRLPVKINKTAPAQDTRVPSQIAAVMFAGISRTGPKLLLAQDGKRGDRELTLQSAGGLVAGDRIRLEAPATPRWNALVRNACKWGTYRRYEFLVESVEGNRVRLNQPLRLEYPTVDGAFVVQIWPLRRCGVEDLSLEQTRDLWTSGIVFSNVWECWARGVTVKKAGRFPLYCLPSKWCEVRDCTFDDAWFKGGGGTAYVGWEYACDCLMENVTTYKLRHAPLVQWSASGNVIRNSVFHASDGQWHSGWTNENLFENCTIDSKTDGGGYGYGLWASPPEDDAHGPNGPRNVVYNCDIASPKAGLWMGGMNEGWLILHNRFTVASGPAIFAKDASFDHTIAGNVFLLQDKTQPALWLATPDCVGVELLNNRVLGGNAKLSGGLGRPLVERDNRLEALAEAPRPQPAVSSIFEWQRANYKVP